MSRYRLVRALLVAGVLLGYGSGIAHVVHHHRHHCPHAEKR